MLLLWLNGRLFPGTMLVTLQLVVMFERAVRPSSSFVAIEYTILQNIVGSKLKRTAFNHHLYRFLYRCC